MRLLGPLVPHALVSVAIVVASLVAMGRAVGDLRVGPEPTASAAIAPTQLSTTGRLAYWRPSPGDDLELWVSDLDGKRRFPIATVPKRAEVDLTRWSPDGGAVAWIADGAVQVVRLDRTRVTVSLPADLPSDWKPMTLEWSPSSRRLAATLRAAHGVSNEGDIFVADLDRPATAWARRTTTGDAYAGPWLDDDRLLVETAGATIGVLSTAGTGPARPLTAMPAVSPLIGPDGRLYFFGGRWGAAPLFSGPLAAGAVWSMTIDGDDLRRETVAERDQGRLQGFLGDGRFIVGVPGALYITGDEAVLFPWKTGVVRRVIASRDGRRVIGLTESRIVRADPAKIPPTASGDPPADATAVLLDSVKAPDAWFPSSPAALAHAARGADGPREALTFTFGRSLWRLGPGGDVGPLLMAPTGGWVGGAIPSPNGDRLVVTVSAPRPSDGRPEPTTVVLDRSGNTVTTLGGAAGTASWSPDGTRLALSVWTDADGYATQIYDTATWKLLERLERTRGVWTELGLVLIDEGRPHASAIPSQGGWFRVGQAIHLLAAAGSRRITDADRLVRHPLLSGLLRSDMETQVWQVSPSPRGGHLIVGLSQFGPDGRNTAGAQVLIRTSDGEPLNLLRSDTGSGGLSGLTWSPSADLLGATLRMPGPPGQDAGTTLVIDVSGATALEREGRFAGWSRDGRSVYVARREGLFEVRIDGGAEVRVSALGVAPVVATTP